jgi:thioester reductase-like protein
MESDIDVGQAFKNAYEESKNRSEVIISEAHRRGAVRASIYRPSVVIGDSRSGRTTHFHGVYAFIRGLWAALERLRRRLPEGSVVHLPLRVRGSMKTTLNFVPIDYVVQGMAAIGANDASLGRTYHLTNPVPTPNSFWLSNICRILRVEGVELVDGRSFAANPPTKLEMLFQKQMAFYYMYLQGEPRFDNRNTAEALAGTGITCPVMTAEFLEKMTGWYLDFLKPK